MVPVAESVFLIVEDHDFQRRTIKRMLNALGAHQVIEASDGKMALNMIQSIARVDYVICDLDMPEMDGMEFLRHLGEIHHMAAAIICSAQEKPVLSSVGKMAAAYGVQLLGIIEKPVTTQRLEQMFALKTQPVSNPIANSDAEFSLDEILIGLRNNQFEAYFQPKIDVQSGSIIGAEALARWRHPERGLIGPMAFIPVLERHHQMDELTHVMLTCAGLACMDWQRIGIFLSVSVNLSLVSLGDTKIADRITQNVRATGLDPHRMVLEITETAAMTEEAPALENLNRLRMRGFGLSVDDYGTGFSSLRQLTRVPFTELKIDQTFVTGCTHHAAARTIIESSVEMAKGLGIKCVAEGVETTDDLETLKSIGCELAQGFYIAKPMDRAAFHAFIEIHAGR